MEHVCCPSLSEPPFVTGGIYPPYGSMRSQQSFNATPGLKRSLKHKQIRSSHSVDHGGWSGAGT